MPTLKRAEAKDRLLAGAALHGDVDIAAKRIDVSASHLEALRAEDPVWSERLDHVAAFDPATAKREHFADFRLRCFGYKTAPHHLRMVRGLHSAEPGSLSMILAFPQAAKTTVLTDWYCWRLAFDPSWRIAVISEGQDLARKIIAQVARRMTDDFVAPEYLRSFGPFQSPDRTRPWNADFLQVLRSKADEKEPSLEARGAGSTLYGGRYDDIVLDDLQSDRSLDATPKLLRYIRQTVLSRPDDHRGKITDVGSRVGVGDIHHRMMDEQMVDNFLSIPALDRPVSAEEHYRRFRRDGKWVIEVNPDCPARPTWPERTTLHQLAVKRQKAGEEVWARTYMQEHIAAGGAVFPIDEIESCLDRDRGLGRNGQGIDCIMTIDPALDTGIAAFHILAYSSSKLVICDTLERGDIHRYEDLYGQVAAWAMRYRPSRVVIEQNNYQKGLHQDDRMLAIAAKYRFALHPHQTHRNKNDPTLGVAAMSSAFHDREVSMPYGDEEARARIQPLVDELSVWRPKSKVKQNLVMSLWFGWMWWQQQRGSMDRIEVVRFDVPSWVRGRRSA